MAAEIEPGLRRFEVEAWDVTERVGRFLGRVRGM